jgi:hypothetical protein
MTLDFYRRSKRNLDPVGCGDGVVRGMRWMKNFGN